MSLKVNSTPATPATKIKTNTTAKIADNQNRSITLRDIKLIMPTVLILLFTILIILTVIPYAFSSVIKQLKAVQAMEQAGCQSNIPVVLQQFDCES